MTHKQTAIPSRTRSAECLECSRPFVPTRAWSRFCGASCRAEHWRRQKAQKQSPPSPGRPAGEMQQPQQLNGAHHTPGRSIRKGSKIAAVLAELARGTRLTRFDAERRLHDHVLPSTVAEIQQRLSIQVTRETVTVPGHGGKPTRCARYWLIDEEKIKAAELLGRSTCLKQN